MAKTAAAEPVTVEDEILGVTEEKPQDKKETREKYLARLVRAGTDDKRVDEDTWKNFSAEAQAWLTTGVEALNSKKPVADFEDAVEEAAEEDEETTEASADEPEEDAEEVTEEDAAEEDEADKPVVKGAGAKKTKKAPAEAKEPRAPGATKQVRRMICENPDWDRKQVDEAIETSGLAIGKTTRNIVYYDTHATMVMLKEIGWKPPKPVAK